MAMKNRLGNDAAEELKREFRVRARYVKGN